PHGSGETTMKKLIVAALGTMVVSVHGQQPPPAQQPPTPDSFRFKSGVELINVTATVSDANGRFVPNLQKDDFLIYEDDQPQTITHFSADRVPVSLGIALDTTRSLAGHKLRQAQGAAGDLGRQRYGEPRGHPRRQAPDPRERDARLCNWHRRHGGNGAARAAAAAARPVPDSISISRPRRSRPVAAEPTAGPDGRMV